MHAGDEVVGVVDTKAPVAGFRWREVGVLAKDASSLRLEGDGAFLGVNLLAIVPAQTLARAHAASAARMEEVPYTLVQQAEVVPGLATRVVAFPGVGRFAETNRTTTIQFDVPAEGEPVLWLRLAKGTPTPLLAIDGWMKQRPTCAADCESDAPWFSAPLGGLGAGSHTMTLAPENSTARPTIDVIAVTTERQGLAWEAPTRVVEVERVDATRYRVQVTGNGPVGLALAAPYDAGWVARAGGGAPVRSVLGDGVTNLFLLETEEGETIVLSYEPQAWAERGVLLTGLSLAMGVASVAGIAVVRIRRGSLRATTRTPGRSPREGLGRARWRAHDRRVPRGGHLRLCLHDVDVVAPSSRAIWDPRCRVDVVPAPLLLRRERVPHGAREVPLGRPEPAARPCALRRLGEPRRRMRRRAALPRAHVLRPPLARAGLRSVGVVDRHRARAPLGGKHAAVRAPGAHGVRILRAAPCLEVGHEGPLRHRARRAGVRCHGRALWPCGRRRGAPRLRVGGPRALAPRALKGGVLTSEQKRRFLRYTITVFAGSSP